MKGRRIGMMVPENGSSELGNVHACPSCGAEICPGNSFCGACNASLRQELDSETTRIEQRAVQEQTEDILSKRVKDQTLVEFQTAERIAERAIKWAKLVGFVIGTPIALLAGLLSFLGVMTYSDLKELTNRLEETRVGVENAQKDTEIAGTRAQALLSLMVSIEADLEQVRGFQKQIAALGKDLYARPTPSWGDVRAN